MQCLPTVQDCNPFDCVNVSMRECWCGARLTVTWTCWHGQRQSWSSKKLFFCLAIVLAQ